MCQILAGDVTKETAFVNLIGNLVMDEINYGNELKKMVGELKDCAGKVTEKELELIKMKQELQESKEREKTKCLELVSLIKLICIEEAPLPQQLEADLSDNLQQVSLFFR